MRDTAYLSLSIQIHIVSSHSNTSPTKLKTEIRKTDRNVLEKLRRIGGKGLICTITLQY